MAAPRTSRRRRPKGEGSVYRTAEGRWRGAIKLAGPDGIRRSVVVSGRTERETRDRLAARRGEVEAGVIERRTVAAYSEVWLARLATRIRPTSVLGARQHLRDYVLPDLGRVMLAELTPAQVEAMTARIIARGRSPMTARHVRATLSSLLADAQRDGLVTRNAARLARAPRVTHREMEVLSGEEARRLIEGTRDDALGPLYALALTTGLREGELLGLRWSDIDERAATLTVRRSLDPRTMRCQEPKTKRSRRTIELGTVALDAVARQRVRQEADRVQAADIWQDTTGSVFTDAIGRPLRAQAVIVALHAATARLGLPGVRFHDLRHTAASLMLAAGVPLITVSRTLGHSTIAITADTYSHLERHALARASAALDGALA